MVTPARQFWDGEPYQCSEGKVGFPLGPAVTSKVSEFFRGAISMSPTADRPECVLDPSSILISCCSEILPHLQRLLASLCSNECPSELEGSPMKRRSTSGRYVATQHAMIAVHISTPERIATFTLSPVQRLGKIQTDGGKRSYTSLIERR